VAPRVRNARCLPRGGLGRPTARTALAYPHPSAYVARGALFASRLAWFDVVSPHASVPYRLACFCSGCPAFHSPGMLCFGARSVASQRRTCSPSTSIRLAAAAPCEAPSIRAAMVVRAPVKAPDRMRVPARTLIGVAFRLAMLSTVLSFRWIAGRELWALSSHKLVRAVPCSPTARLTACGAAGWQACGSSFSRRLTFHLSATLRVDARSTYRVKRVRSRFSRADACRSPSLTPSRTTQSNLVMGRHSCLFRWRRIRLASNPIFFRHRSYHFTARRSD